MNDVHQAVTPAEREAAQMLLSELSRAYEHFLRSPRGAEGAIELRCDVILGLWNGDPRLRAELKLLAPDVRAMREELARISFTNGLAELRESALRAFDSLLAMLRADMC